MSSPSNLRSTWVHLLTFRSTWVHLLTFRSTWVHLLILHSTRVHLRFLVRFTLLNLPFSVTTSTWPLGTLHSITSLLAAATHALEYRISWEIYTPYEDTAGRNCTFSFLMLYQPSNNMHYEYWKSIIFGVNINFTVHFCSLKYIECLWWVKYPIFCRKNPHNKCDHNNNKNL